MSLISGMLKLFLVVLVLGVGIYFFGDRVGIQIPQDKIPDQLKNISFSTDSLSEIGKYTSQVKIDASTSAQVNQTLAGIYENAQSFSSDAGKVLGAAVEATSSGKPLHEQAFEYGRYLYCQQVVEDWDARKSSTSPQE